MKSILYFISLSLFASNSAFAFGNFLNSSQLLQKGEYNLSAYSQFFSSDRSGVYTSAALDLPLTQETNLRLSGGMGSYDFSLGGSLKWVPITQEKNNLFNLGGVLSAEWAKDDPVDSFLFRAAPFISRSFGWELGQVEPYLSLPFGMVAYNSQTEVSAQFITGLHLKFEQLNYMSFNIEGGFKVKNAESYFALMATLQLSK